MNKKLLIPCTIKYPLDYWFVALAIFALRCGTPASSAINAPDTLVIKEKQLIPEGIAIHPSTGTVYLSSLHQNKIVMVDNKGNCKDLISSGQAGFMKGIGIKISPDGKTLWACSASLDTVKSKSALFGIDLNSGKVTDTIFYENDSSSLFNDIAIHSTGDIYFTDTFLASIFRYRPSDKTLERWLTSQHLTLANGIAFSTDEKVLFVASGDKGIQRVTMANKDINPVSRGKRTDYAIDGLVYHNKVLYGVIGWPQQEFRNHRVISYHLNYENYLETVDTVIINSTYMKVPTTAAIYEDRLYTLSKTNLGLYNRAKQSVNGVEDSLEFPMILKLTIKEATK